MRHDEEFYESFSFEIEEEDNKFDAKQFAHDKCVFDHQLLWRDVKEFSEGIFLFAVHGSIL
jgi:hypothetical protein